MKIADGQQFNTKTPDGCAKCDLFTIDTSIPNFIQVQTDVVDVELFTNGNFDNSVINIVNDTFDLGASGWINVLNMPWNGPGGLTMCYDYLNGVSNLASISKTFNLLSNSELNIKATIQYGNLALGAGKYYELIVIEPITFNVIFSKIYNVSLIEVKTVTIDETIPIITAGNYDVVIVHVGDFFMCVNGVITTNTQTGIILDNFTLNLNTEKLEYIYRDLPIDGKLLSTISLQSDEYYKIKFWYFTNDEFSYKINIYDSLSSLVFTETIALQKGYVTGNYIAHYFTAPATDTYTIEFIFTPNDSTNELLIDDISVKEICTIDKVELQDVNGNLIWEFDSDQNGLNSVIYNQNIALIELDIQQGIDDGATGQKCFRLEIFDTCGNSIITNIFEQYNEISCKEKYIKLEWYSNCKINGIDYTNLPMVNHLYIKGYIKRLPLEQKEKVTYLNSNRESNLLYQHSNIRHELFIGKYSTQMHEILEIVFMNTFVLIDEKQYFLDEKDYYSIREISDYYYTGKVELIKNSYTSSSCCC